MEIVGQEKLVKEIKMILDIFETSGAKIRPHFILAGESGSGKTFTIRNLVSARDMNFMDINAAQLTKEGTAGNSLSKALTPLINMSDLPTVIFVDEFDKLFISGNNNSALAHETTNGVQNEFLKVLEADQVSVYHDYGKYVNVPSNKILFIFSGAFNGEADITLDRLRDFGVKTEFLGRVGLVYNTKPLELEDLNNILEHSELLKEYLTLFDGIDREEVVNVIKNYLVQTYAHNTIGARLINTLISQYFIKGGQLEVEQVKEISFTKKLSFTK